MSTLEPVLARHPFFKDLEPQYLQLLVGCAGNVVFKPGETIAAHNEEADRFYLIREGKVAVGFHSPERGAITIQTLTQGDILGWDWLLPPYRWHLDARAVETTRAIGLDGRCLRQKCAADHHLGYEFLMRFTPVVVQQLEATRFQLLDVFRAPGSGN
ncbi:MAG TPA: cyclic nucleotide-binding domain-containing protein [Pirellulales bacterium]|nr:cyclic nucleotide-binding domain-containing protein [Pirellulales bacterium]